MALFHPFSKFTLLLLTTLLSSLVISHQQPLPPNLSSDEQDAVYQVLNSINPTIPWPSLFPDDLCSSAPHGVVCDYFSDSPDAAVTAHVTELSFGYVSDYTPNPPCSANASINPLLFTSFNYLRKLFFYHCFTGEMRVSFPDNIPPPSFGATLEELVFVDNPSFVGPLSGILRNFTNLRRVVLTGNSISGNIPDAVSDMVNLEELTLSRNNLGGEIPASFGNLKKLKILDLGFNHFDGNVPETAGNSTELVKLDVSNNGLFGKIPESFKNLKKLELLDVSFNKLSNGGVPMFLSEMPRLKQLFLSGNLMGGQIPEIWENLGGLLGIGFSGMGLIGEIPASMGVYLKNLSYLGLDNNKLEGEVPEELIGILENVNEINLENNSLSGRVALDGNFSGKFGHKLKLGGNPGLCVEGDGGGFKGLKVCNKTHNPKFDLVSLDAASSSSSAGQVVVGVVNPSVIIFATWVLFGLIFA